MNRIFAAAYIKLTFGKNIYKVLALVFNELQKV